MRQRLNALVFAGEKVATAGLWEQDYRDEVERIEQVGEHQRLLDDAESAIATVEITKVETHRFLDVPWEFAKAEGEGFQSIEHWRDGHKSYYSNQGVAIDDDTLFVCTWFRLVDPCN